MDWAEIGVFNNGIKVAGTDYANLVLHNKYTLTIQGGEYIRLAAGGIAYWDAYAVVPVDSGSVRFYRADFPVVEQGGKVRAHTDHIGKTIECYSFGPVTPGSELFGVELFDANAKQTFNSARPFLRLKGVHIDARNGMLDFQVGNASYSSQNTGLGQGMYAWSAGNSRFFYRRTQYNGGFTDEFEGVLSVRVDDAGIYSNLSIQFGATKRTNAWVGYGSHVPGTGPIVVLVADVTGL